MHWRNVRVQPLDQVWCHIWRTFASFVKNKVGSSIGSSFKTTGQNMLQVSKMLTGKSFFRRLKTITSTEDGVANDKLHHNQCWVIAKRKEKPKSSKHEDHVYNLSEIEPINFVENYMQCGANPVLVMNKVDSVYKNVLIENGMKKDRSSWGL